MKKSSFLKSLGIVLVCGCLTHPLQGYAQTNQSAASFGDGLKTIGDAISTSTNWTLISGYGHATKGGNNVAFADLAYNFNNYAGIVVGYDYLWNTTASQFNSVKGGVSLQLPMHPLGFLGTSWATNVVAAPFVADLIATPKNGDAIGNILTTGVNFDLYKFSRFELVGGIQLEKRTGQGDWNGNYWLGHIGISRRF